MTYSSRRQRLHEQHDGNPGKGAELTARHVRTRCSPLLDEVEVGW
ncbi:hypothetical protein SAMN05443637_13079 [Pseudonocardia thermophila]|jgi:hypothetical protein|uniref:Uncharacterized protein n=1 Tax=Pseudonocardia thermophila TaxID=1848 RepID=A0A1M7AYX2_PSETH|nr:hypothetical protein [Pseudonocardia thermophila]SHL47837.1 hypothetical protein SAMN05443637_13079 [Pseudonocardia thermophila]